MTIYAAISPRENEKLTAAVISQFGDDYFKVSPGQYLIYAPKSTTKQVADTLGISGGGLGKVLLVQILNYKGWHSRDMWEWLGSKTGASGATTQPPDDEL